MKKIQNQKKGFTLLEILLVIALIGILVTIIIVVLNPKSRFASARNDTRQSDIKKIEGALIQYRLQEGSYPVGLDGTLRDICDPDIANPSTNCGININLSVLVPIYLQSIPQDPNDKDTTGGNGYQVAVDTTRNIVAVKAIQAESSATISINDTLLSGLPSPLINTPLADSKPGGLPNLALLDGSAINDPYWSNVSLLLKFDDSNGSTTFIDSSSSNLSITGVGDTKISTVQSKFGGSSACFDGNGDYLTLDSTSSLYNFNSDFTIEGWFYKTDNQDDIIIASPQGGPSNNQIFRVNGNSIGIYQDAWIFNMESYSIPLNTWHHFAYTRSGINNYLFINGTQVGTVKAYSGTFRIGSIGRDIWGINQYTGCIDDLRLTKGVARYTTNFTPPTQSFTPPPPASPSNTNISLLMNCNGSSFVDSSIYARAITIQAGTPSLSSVQSKFGSKSCLLNSGSSLGFNDTTELDLTGDFTIESWIYPLSTGAGDRIVAGHSSQNVQIFRINEGGSGTGTLSFYLNGTQVFSPVAAGITPNNWYHVAISRSGTVTKMFVNGVQVGSNNTTWSGSFKINRIGVFWLNSYFDGYIDDFRVTKGVSWYNSNFTPPTAQLTP
jgi:prepilin-type N-terminal cleavage/methylation domain-containing protein